METLWSAPTGVSQHEGREFDSEASCLPAWRSPSVTMGSVLPLTAWKLTRLTNWQLKWRKDRKQTLKSSAELANAKEISMNVAVGVLFSHQNLLLYLKKMQLKVFLC